MKNGSLTKKNYITIGISVAVLVVCLGLIYRYFAPPTSDDTIKVTVPHKVTPTFNQDQINELQNPDLKDYTPDITPNFPDKQRVF